ncbi:MAG: hypothetical protein U0894_18645 [Pirellulales bacterium]
MADACDKQGCDDFVGDWANETQWIVANGDAGAWVDGLRKFGDGIFGLSASGHSSAKTASGGTASAQ